jgi:hypothetical protein
MIPMGMAKARSIAGSPIRAAMIREGIIKRAAMPRRRIRTRRRVKKRGTAVNRPCWFRESAILP